jgi:hypothetical protein
MFYIVADDGAGIHLLEIDSRYRFKRNAMTLDIPDPNFLLSHAYWVNGAEHSIAIAQVIDPKDTYKRNIVGYVFKMPDM